MRLEAHRFSWRGIRLLLTVGLAFACFTAPASASTITRHSSFTYDPVTGLLTSETVEPSATDSTYLKTTYTYDQFGNKVSTTTSTYANANGAARTTTATYDTKGEFRTKDCNALNQCETWTNDQRFGTPTSHTGPNGLTTAWTYDGFGRKTLETRPDGNKTAFTYTYCSGVNGGTDICIQYDAFSSGGIPENSAGVVNGPKAFTYFDALSRSHDTQVLAFDGANWSFTSTQYDAFGRVAQTSRPYFINGGTPKWTTFAYDDLGRVVKATAPDGSITTTAWHGLSTSVTNSLGQTTTTVKNAQGLNATVTDALGKVTSYGYDAEGDPIWIDDAAGDVATNTFDVRGRKTASTDPDMGHWTYVYDAFGELTSQTDAKGQLTTLSYDVLGRVMQRVDGSGTATWTYDTALKGVGQLASTTTGTSYTRSHSYDSLGRPASVTLTISGTAYTYTATYNTDGRVDTVSYPSGLALKYVYTALGYLSQVKDNATGVAYWTANARDAELHLTGATLGNGVGETQSFDANTGLVQQILAGTANGVANFHYSFDTLGNLTQRQDTIEGTTENFCYDALNRLTNYALGGTTCTTGTAGEVKSVSYDAIGNILAKSDVGTYTYGTGAGPHAVTGVAGTVNGVLNPAYSYDADGNMTSGAGRTVTWTAFNMVAQITQGTTTVAFAYDSEHTRITQTIGGASPSTTTYLNALGASSEKFVAGASTTWRDYIQADGHIVAEKFSGSTAAVRYFVLDHLSSVAVVTDETGAVTERLSYDAWGQRRCANGTGNASCFTASATTRGFTNQEEIDQVGLVNLNSRIYDPVLGRFMSADPTIEAPFIPQDLNRYTYTGNNPLSFTDTSGLCFLGCFFKSGIFKAVLTVALFAVGLPELEGFNVFASGFSLASLGLGTLVANAAIAGGLTAGIAGDNILKGAFYSAIGAGLTFGIGGPLGSALTNALGSSLIGNFIGLGLAGGITSVIQGGNFGSGFLAAGVGSIGGSLGIGGGQFNPGALIVSAALGGAASVLGGGKFANGAITAAFAYAASADYGSNTASGQEPDDVSNDVQPNGHLAITAEDNRISATISVGCGYGISDCTGDIALLNAANATAGAITLDLLFVPVAPGTIPDITLIARPLPGTIAAQTCCFNTTTVSGGVNFTFTTNDNRSITIDLAKFNSATGDLTHEVGHVLGLHHESNITNSLMSYSPTRATTFNADELQRLYNAYHH